ncbi:MAG: zinc-binding dehydrogenase [Chloroflexota bacterium]
MHSNTMRYDDDGRIHLMEIDVPDPAENEVQLAGGACGICSWDIATVKLGHDMYPKAPAGHEGVGYVAKVGRNVQGIQEGDRVAGGGFATVRNVPAERVYKIPESTLADEHWIVEPVSCAVTGIDHCRVQAGNRIAVIGAGFMGQLILQGLLRSPLDQLVAVDVIQDRLDLAQNVGVKEVINSTQMDRGDLVRELKARNFDVVVDTTGHQAGLDLATDIIKPGGLINLFGWLKGEQATFDPTKWHLGGYTIVNSAPGSKIRDPFPMAIRLIHQGVFDLSSLVTHVVPLNDYPTLMQQIVGGEPSYVKGVVQLG